MGFIISDKGFLLDIESTVIKSEDGKREGVTIKVLYSNSLIGCKDVTKKQATVLIKKHNISGFYWSPKKEFPVRDKWEITQRDSGRCFMTDEEHIVGEWYPRRMMMTSNSDLSFLMSGKVIEGLSEGVAYSECIRLNREMVEELEDKTIDMEKNYKRLQK